MREPTTTGYAALTEKEKETLRLVVRGHDAKSTARHLGLSVHTINERLRDARRKLAVSSSREAARLLLEQEGGAPQTSGDKQIGEAAQQGDVRRDDEPEQPHRFAPRAMGVVIMSLVLGLTVLVALPQPGSVTDGGASSVEAADSAAVTFARDWLMLVDQGRWDDSWAATSASFRKLNTTKAWEAASQQARVPLGAVRSRVLLSQESVPAPPKGIEVVKFRTSFANKPNAVETLSLAREDGVWRVVGIYIE